MDKITALSQPILPGRAIGPFKIGTSIRIYLKGLVEGVNYTKYTEEHHYPEAFIDFVQTYYSFYDGAIEVWVDENEIIGALVCNNEYIGKLNNEFYPGYPITAIQKNTDKFHLYDGAIKIRGFENTGFVVPMEYDYISSINDFPRTFNLNKLFTEANNWRVLSAL